MAICKMQRRPEESAYGFASLLWRRAQPFFGKEISSPELYRYLLDGLREEWTSANAGMHIELHEACRSNQPFSRALELLRGYADRRPGKRTGGASRPPPNVSSSGSSGTSSSLRPSGTGVGRSTATSSSSLAGRQTPHHTSSSSTGAAAKDGLKSPIRAKVTCFACQEPGHLRKDCPNRRTNSVEGGQRRKTIVEIVTAEGFNLQAELDSGTAFHLLPETVARQLQLDIQPLTIDPQLRAANGSRIQLMGQVDVELHWGRAIEKLRFLVASTVDRVLLSWAALNELGRNEWVQSHNQRSSAIQIGCSSRIFFWLWSRDGTSVLFSTQ